MKESYLRPQRPRGGYQGKMTRLLTCSYTSNWPLMGANDVETLSQLPSVVMGRLNGMYSSAVQGQCGFCMKAKKNLGSRETMSCLML